jgi:hypothetical protein
MRKFFILMFFVSLAVSTSYITSKCIAKPPRFKQMSVAKTCGLYWDNISVDGFRTHGLPALNAYVTFECKNGNDFIRPCGVVYYYFHIMNRLNPNEEYYEAGNSGTMHCGDVKKVRITFDPLNAQNTYYYEWTGYNNSGTLWTLTGFMKPQDFVW